MLNLKNRQFGKEGYFAMKIDTSKPYGRIEWQFLLAIVRKLGFSEKWIYLVSQCISIVFYSIMLNRYLSETFFFLERS